MRLANERFINIIFHIIENRKTARCGFRNSLMGLRVTIYYDGGIFSQSRLN